MSAPPQNLPFGPGFDQTSATNFATDLARKCDALHAQADYIVDTYSPFTSDEIAAYWAQSSMPPLDSPTPEMLDRANQFKSWIATVKAMIDAGFDGDVGYQIRRWRDASPPPNFR